MGLRLDSKCDCTPPNLLVGASPLPLDVGYLCLVGSSIILLIVVQQLVAILVFLQKMSSCPFTLPSCLTPKSFRIVNEIKVDAFLEFPFFL